MHAAVVPDPSSGSMRVSAVLGKSPEMHAMATPRDLRLHLVSAWRDELEARAAG